MPEHRGRRWFRHIVIVYLVLLVISTVIRWRDSRMQRTMPLHSVVVQEVAGLERRARPVTISYEVFSEGAGTGEIPVVLLHGSPGLGSDFELLAPLLDPKRKMISPDLPGFGKSTRKIPDYSIAAHADYIIQMMDALSIERAHFVGFSMGGGVSLNVAARFPERVVSLTMLSSIGVQEMELLGEYHINHLIHGVQLAVIWSVLELTPHFGYFDNRIISVEYAHNFYDTDQRPLRDLIKGFRAPVLIIHGQQDTLVPVQAAIEHQRLIPQSEIALTTLDHFMLFLDPSVLAPSIRHFLDAVESGSAIPREKARTERVVQSDLPFDPSTVPKAVGLAAIVLFILLAIATLVSEDLTCVAAGLMVSEGRAGFLLVTAACVFGIFVGDILLFLAGRYLGRPALRHAPLKWFIKADAFERSSQWFSRRGAVVILASRFFPGMRLPTYFAAGVLDTNLAKFTLYFLGACLVWTPLLVGASVLFGGELARRLLTQQGNIFLRIGFAALITLIAIKLITRVLTKRGRRSLLGRWRRIRHWEFWSPFVFYPPVALYVGYLMFKYRSITLFTLANPGIPAGGFIGESKSAILEGLKNSGDAIARFTLIRAEMPAASRVERARVFMKELGLSFPLVLKPDVGQRGSGVKIVRSEDDLAEYLQTTASDTIAQEFIDGEEFGVFYYRFPRETRGRVYTITTKKLPRLNGDGRRNLEELILDDDRLVAMAGLLLRQEQRRLEWIPARDESVEIVELGTHCRGAIFLDGGRLNSVALEEQIDQISRSYEGFFFGRYDLKVESAADLSAAKNLKILELNGVTSEATSIYDPGNTLFNAYRVLFRQWQIAFEIGKQNRDRGFKPTPLRDLVSAIMKGK